MARIRSIKPEFFTSDTVTALPMRARLTWIGMWTHCDDYGRCRDNVKLIKAAVWPLDDVSLRDVTEDLDALIEAGLVFKYEAAGKRYLQVTGWSEHQKVDRPSRSSIPPPPSTDNASYPQESPRERLASPREQSDREQGTGSREGRGTRARDQDEEEAPSKPSPATPPPRTCPKHPNSTSDRCGPCKEARLHYEQWEHDQAQNRTDQTRLRQQQPRCRCGVRHLPSETCDTRSDP